MLLDELREAISIEIQQKSSKTERVPHSMNRIVQWSENLLHCTEEPVQVQFAHSSIRDFITGKAASSQVSGFHVDAAKADNFVGETCMTCLYFSDFTTTIARQQPVIRAKPANLAAAILEEDEKTARISGLVTKLASRGGKTIVEPDLNRVFSVTADRDGMECAEREQLKSSHPFLTYAATY